MIIYDIEKHDNTYRRTKNVVIYDFEEETMRTVDLTNFYSGFHVDVLFPNILLL